MNENIIKRIKELTKEIKTENDLEQDVIREDVFNILQNISNCIVLYYPLEEEANEDGCDGCHVIRTVNGVEKQLVFINSANTKERQAFSVAHELGHIWKVDERLKKSLPGEDFEVEDVINRFAAELLMPEYVFVEQTQKRIDEIRKNQPNKNNGITILDVIKLIVYLMDYFFSPYKAVVIRLVETGFLNEESKEKMLKYKESDLVESIIQEKQCPRLGIKTKKKSIANLNDKLDEIEKRELFSENKIKAIREKFDLTEIKEDREMNDVINISRP